MGSSLWNPPIVDMDLSLWDPPVYEDNSSHFGGNLIENSHSNLCCGYGHDVIEEDALNEEACKEVLKLRTAKVDAEVEELEEVIVMLEKLLDCADEVWLRFCSTYLIERIKSLGLLIQRLKNEKQQTEHAPDFRSQMHGELAVTLNEILTTLLNSFHPNIEEELALIDKLSTKIEKLAAGHSKDQTKLSNVEEEACGTKILEETAEPLRMANEAGNVKETDQNGDYTTSSDLMTNFCGHVTDVATQRDISKFNSSNQIGQLTGFQDSTTNAETRIYATEVDKLADMASDCTREGEERIANRTNPMDTTERMITKHPQKMLSDSECTYEQSLNCRKRKARSEVVGMEPHNSILSQKSGNQQMTEELSFVSPEPSSEMKEEPKLSSVKDFKRPHTLKFKENKSSNIAADVSLDSVCRPTKRREKPPLSPSIEENEESRNLQVNPKMDEGVTSSLIKGKDEGITKNDQPKHLNSLTLVDLRAMAKERKLRKYSKLNRNDLIKLLGLG